MKRPRLAVTAVGLANLVLALANPGGTESPTNQPTRHPGPPANSRPFRA